MLKIFAPYLFLFLLFLFLPILLISQVGIGTQDIESGLILKMEAPDKGILIPRVKLTNINTQAPIEGIPTTGLLVYNEDPTTMNQGFYVWDENTSSWGETIKPVVRSTAKYVNIYTTTDFNNKINLMNIFDSEVYNDAPDLYKKYSGGITIHQTGLYKLTLNLDLDGTSDRDIFAVDAYVNNIKIPETFYVSTVDNALGSNQDIGYVFTVYVNIPATTYGSHIYFIGREVDGATKVYFKGAGTSSITIEKIR